MLVAQQRDATLQVFTQDGSNACNLMDNEQHNTPRLVCHTSWILLLGVRSNSGPMLVKPGGHFNYVEPAGVVN